MKRNLKIFGLVMFLLTITTFSEASTPRYKEEYSEQEGTAQIIVDTRFHEDDYELNTLSQDGRQWIVLSPKDKRYTHVIEGEAGSPELLVLTYHIQIPKGAKIKDIVTREYQRHSRELSEHIKPVPKSVPAGTKPKPLFIDEKIYESSIPYPTDEISYEVVNAAHTYMIILTVCTFEYIGKTKALIGKSLEVEIDLEEIPEESHSKQKITNEVDRYYRDYVIINPKSILIPQGGAR